MKLQSTYSDTFKEAIATQRFSVGHLYRMKFPLKIDAIGCYKIFLVLAGEKKFHIDNEVYDVRPGDMFLINQREFHYFSQVNTEESQERIVCFIYPDFLKAACTELTDLTACFHCDSSLRHKLVLSEKEQARFMHMVEKLSGEEPCQDVLDYGLFLEMMVFVNRIVQSRKESKSTEVSASGTQSKQLKEILAYINLHITEDIPLETIAEQFFISPSYLCRVFKSGTGTTIHRYITAKRIMMAKDLLAEGYSCLEASSMSGFKDYNGFFKSFVKAVGVSPAKYGQFELK